MKVLDLFSGIGGFSLGLERAGMETVAFCEIDKFCQKVLKKHWPKIPIYNDVKELDGTLFRGAIDLVCGGFPCQPFSTAGKQQGRSDDRDLWPEMFRVIREAQPAWVIGENVAGFINMELQRTANDLEAEGYETQAFIIPACAVGAPHERKRCWIVAHATGNNDRRSPGEFHEKDGGQSGGLCIESSNASTLSSFVANTLRKGFSVRHEQYSDREKKEGIFTGSQFERIYAEIRLEQQWQVEPDVGRVANGIPSRVDRLKALGNAVVPQIPEIIGRAIMELENNSYAQQ